MKINNIKKILKIAAVPALSISPILSFGVVSTNNSFVKAETINEYTFENWIVSSSNTEMTSTINNVEGEQQLTITADISVSENNSITVKGITISNDITTDNKISLKVSFNEAKDENGYSYFITTFGDGQNGILRNDDLDSHAWLSNISIICPKYLQSISTKAFYFDQFTNSVKFTGITLNSALVYIMNNAFQNCAYLTGDIVIPSGTRTIGNNAFDSVGSKAENKPNLFISEGVWYIGSGAFNNAIFNNDYNIPSSIIYIGKNAFAVSDPANAKNITFNMMNFDQYNYTSSESTDYFYGLSSLDGVNAKLYVPSQMKKNIESAANEDGSNSIWKTYIQKDMILSITNTNSLVGGIIVGVSVAILLVAFGIAIYRNKKNRPQSPKESKNTNVKEVKKTSNKTKTKKNTK